MLLLSQPQANAAPDVLVVQTDGSKEQEEVRPKQNHCRV
jgi:hypothetical protein